MRRPAPEQLRRIDRLSWRAHGFHRFAHHPLCAGYASEVLRLGPRVRICRGCALAGIGAAAGLVAGVAAPRLGGTAQGLLLASGCAWAAVLARWRVMKAGSRFAPAALAGFLAIQGLRSGLCGWARTLLVLAATLAFLRHYRRRGPHREPCAACPERPGPGTCSGLRAIERRERAFRRLAGRWLQRGA